MEGAAGAVADSRERAVGDGGDRWQCRGLVGDASVAPQNPACEVPLWYSDYSDSTGSFIGVDFVQNTIDNNFIFSSFLSKKKSYLCN